LIEQHYFSSTERSQDKETFPIFSQINKREGIEGRGNEQKELIGFDWFPKLKVRQWNCGK